MGYREPRLCLDKTLRRYYVKWGGRRRWLGTDRPQAEVRHSRELAAWAKWRAERVAKRVRQRIRTRHRIAELYQMFIRAKAAEGCSPFTVGFYNTSLRRFLRDCGHYFADDFSVQELHSFKQDLIRLGLAPKTVNHELCAVRTLFQWAGDLEFCEPANLRGCRNLAVREGKPKAWTPERLRGNLRLLPKRALPWAVTQYACLMRPMEIVRAVHQQGDWDEPGIFIPAESKSEWRSKRPRRIVFSEFALEWLEKCEPCWTRLDSYGTVFSRAGIAGGPHPLRHSGASHLLKAGVDRVTVDLIRGSLPSAVSTIYAPVEWQPLRAITARLRENLRDVV